jgi:tetratricopeptide (TPR) repeat protein
MQTPPAQTSSAAEDSFREELCRQLHNETNFLAFHHTITPAQQEVSCNKIHEILTKLRPLSQDNPQHESIFASAMTDSGIVLFQNAGRREEGMLLLQEALRMRRRLYNGQAHEDLVKSLIDVGSALRELGFIEDGLRLEQEALEMCKKLWGSQGKHQLMAGALNNVGRGLLQLGQREEGATMMKAALEMQRRIYNDEDHEDLAVSYNNVGTFLGEAGHLQEGFDLEKFALDMRLRLYKDQPHRALADSFNNVGVILVKMQKPHEAGQYFRKAIAMQERLVESNAAVEEVHLASFLRNYAQCLKCLAVLAQQQADEVDKRHSAANVAGTVAAWSPRKVRMLLEETKAERQKQNLPQQQQQQQDQVKMEKRADEKTAAGDEKEQPFLGTLGKQEPIQQAAPNPNKV